MELEYDINVLCDSFWPSFSCVETNLEPASPRSTGGERSNSGLDGIRRVPTPRPAAVREVRPMEVEAEVSEPSTPPAVRRDGLLRKKSRALANAFARALRRS